jgi:hypothetical protein
MGAAALNMNRTAVRSAPVLSRRSHPSSSRLQKDYRGLFARPKSRKPTARSVVMSHSLIGGWIRWGRFFGGARDGGDGGVCLKTSCWNRMGLSKNTVGVIDLHKILTRNELHRIRDYLTPVVLINKGLLGALKWLNNKDDHFSIRTSKTFFGKRGNKLSRHSVKKSMS